jgi:hypothetical protein
MKEVNAHMKKITFKFVSKINIYSYQAYESCLVSITSVEEVRELGAGTFGTIYLAKWRHIRGKQEDTQLHCWGCITIREQGIDYITFFPF